MNIKLKAFSLILLALFLSGEVKAQDPEFTQFYAIPIYTNPAFAGTSTCERGGSAGGRAVLNYRNQWPSLPGTFVTTAASWDQYFGKLGGGLGLMVMNDRAGEGLLTSTTVSAVYSYQWQVSPNFSMAFGIEGQYGQRSIDWQRLRFEDQISPTQGFVLPTNEPYANDQVSFANFSTGMLAYTKNFYGGFAVHNLIEPNQSFYGSAEAIVPRRFTGHGGVVIPLDGRRVPESTFSPNVLFMLQNKFTQMNIGFYLNKGPLVTGLWFRQTFGEFGNSDALMALIGFRKDKFKFGYSYDLTVSDARAAAPGSHEVSASIEWCTSVRPPKFKPIHCPSF